MATIHISLDDDLWKEWKAYDDWQQSRLTRVTLSRVCNAALADFLGAWQEKLAQKERA